MNKKLILSIVILLNVLFISDIRAMSISIARVVEVLPIKSYEEMRAELLRKDADKKFFNSPFYTAVINGDSRYLRCLLDIRERYHDSSFILYRDDFENGLDIRSGDGSSFLHYAVDKGNICCIQELLKAGIFVDGQNNNGYTPLHCAAQKGNVDCMRELIDAGADINEGSHFRISPLHCAAENGHLKSVQWLIESGASVRILGGTIYEQTNFELMEYVNIEYIKRKHGNNKRVVQPFLNFFLVRSILRDSPLGIANAIKFGAKINYQQLFNGDTSMHVAVKCKNPKIVAYLLQFKPDLTIKNKDGDTALQLAVYKHGVRGLLEVFGEGAFICPKVLLYEAIFDNDKEGLERLIYQRPTLLHKKNENGYTPLHCAVIQENQDMVEFLLKNGANPSVTNDDGDSCLHLAAQGGNRNILERLLKCGVNPNITNDDGDSCLHLVARGGNKNILEVLLKYGVNPCQTNVNGETPIDIAEKQGCKDNISMLKKARLKRFFARVFKIITSPLHYSGRKCRNILYTLKNFVFRPYTFCLFFFRRY